MKTGKKSKGTNYNLPEHKNYFVIQPNSPESGKSCCKKQRQNKEGHPTMVSFDK